MKMTKKKSMRKLKKKMRKKKSMRKLKKKMRKKKTMRKTMRKLKMTKKKMRKTMPRMVVMKIIKRKVILFIKLSCLLKMLGSMQQLIQLAKKRKKMTIVMKSNWKNFSLKINYIIQMINKMVIYMNV